MLKKIKEKLSARKKRKAQVKPMPEDENVAKKTIKKKAPLKKSSKKSSKKFSKNSPRDKSTKDKSAKNKSTRNNPYKNKGKPKKAAAKRSTRVKDPEAKQEAKKYDNPVASRTLILKTIKKAGMMTQDAFDDGLHLRNDQEEGFSRLLNAMVRDGQLVRNRRCGYLPVDEKNLIKGHVIAHADGFGFLVPDEGGDDLFLSARQMRGVLHGDHAVATISGIDRRGRREGSIVSVVQRANTTLIFRAKRNFVSCLCDWQ